MRDTYSADVLVRRNNSIVPSFSTPSWQFAVTYRGTPGSTKGMQPRKPASSLAGMIVTVNQPKELRRICMLAYPRRRAPAEGVIDAVACRCRLSHRPGLLSELGPRVSCVTPPGRADKSCSVSVGLINRPPAACRSTSRMLAGCLGRQAGGAECPGTHLLLAERSWLSQPNKCPASRYQVLLDRSCDADRQSCSSLPLEVAAARRSRRARRTPTP